MSESSVDKSIVPEYSELLNLDENSKTNPEPKQLNNNSSSIGINTNITTSTNNFNNNNSNITSTTTTTNPITNNENPVQFGDVEMTSVEISTQPAILPQSVAPVKAIEKQIETRRADGKRRITAVFVPFSVDLDG